MPEYLAGCINQALNTTGSILECGSGLSTIVIGAMTNGSGRRYWALEDNPQWGRKVKEAAVRYDLRHLVLSVDALKDYGDFFWYDAPLESMPHDFDLVICDGPPGSTKGGRYGLLPIMAERLKPGCVILVDDAGRKQEQSMVERWEAELGAASRMMGTNKPYLTLTLSPNPVA